MTNLYFLKFTPRFLASKILSFIDMTRPPKIFPMSKQYFQLCINIDPASDLGQLAILVMPCSDWFLAQKMSRNSNIYTRINGKSLQSHLNGLQTSLQQKY